MPLVKSASKQAFGKNVATEMKAGRPQKQAVAIAYSEKRAAQRKHHSEHDAVASAGESVMKKKPSGSSTASHPEHHSSHSARRSHNYHSQVVDASAIRPSSTKMTKSEHRLNNQEDVSEATPKGMM